MTQLKNKLDRRPPSPTGNTQADIQRIVEYLESTREAINVILAQIYKSVNSEGG